MQLTVRFHSQLLAVVVAATLVAVQTGYAQEKQAAATQSSVQPTTAPATPTIVWLDELDLKPMRQAWGAPQANKSVTGEPLSIAGQRFERGVGSHASSLLYVKLAGGAERFTASVGVDDDTADPRSSVYFRVIGDGQTLFRSPVMKAGTPAMQIDAPLHGVDTLVLMVGATADGINYDHADWADAKFEVTGVKPETMPTPREEAVILTPPPSKKPRINGAKVFGVRPGSPVLFTIAATGERPMTFSAENLPAGLNLDARTGRISGSLGEPGEHIITLHANNARGRSTRPLKIVCGDTLALTPPMGWNSWYVHEGRVTDRDIRAAANAMVSTSMINHGYTYVNVDDCWMIKADSTDPVLGGQPRDANGRLRSNRRFPNMKALADYIHSKGLRAGIYISPGPTTCAGFTGSYQHEEQDAQTFADWGYDFLKYDWCSYGSIAKDQSLPELQKPYKLMGDIIKQLDRDIVFNLCQYGMGDVSTWGAEVGGNCWRTTGDLGGSFDGIPEAMYSIGFGQAGLEKWAGPGHWNDPDYLVLGYLSNWKGGMAPTPLTPNEQYTQMSLWCLLAAPLIFSGDMTKLDDFTLSLLTNDEVIEVNQDPLGQQAHPVTRTDDIEVWAKDMEDGSTAVGLFNRGEFETKITVQLSDLGVKEPRLLRDLWRQADLGTVREKFTASVPRHGVVLVRLIK